MFNYKKISNFKAVLFPKTQYLSGKIIETIAYQVQGHDDFVVCRNLSFPHYWEARDTTTGETLFHGTVEQSRTRQDATELALCHLGRMSGW